MELGYDMLWRVCTWFLVSFLVARLVSLIVSFSSCNSTSGYVKHSSFKRFDATVDHDHGKKLKVDDNGRRVIKRVKFDDQLVNVVEFDSVEEVFVRDVEMDCGKLNVVVNDDDLGEKFGGEVINDEKLVDKESDGGFEMGKVGFDDYGESGEFVKELVDQVVERKACVGNDEKVGGELESGVIVVDCNDIIVGCGGCEEKERIVHDIKEGIVLSGNEEVHDIGEDLGGDKVVDDDQSKESSSGNVHRGGEMSGVVEFVGDSSEGVVECGDKKGYALGVGLDVYRSEEVSPSNAQNEKESGMEINRDEGVLSDDDDEWEGIERSELEKKFASAVNFVECRDSDGRLAKVGSDAVTQLYGLQKIAMEGQCHESQPMALKLYARAKWNAWQRLGNMSREDAMEQYVDLLSDSISGWMEDHSSEINQTKIFDGGVDSLTAVNSSTHLPNQDKE